MDLTEEQQTRSVILQNIPRLAPRTELLGIFQAHGEIEELKFISRHDHYYTNNAVLVMSDETGVMDAAPIRIRRMMVTAERFSDILLEATIQNGIAVIRFRCDFHGNDAPRLMEAVQSYFQGCNLTHINLGKTMNDALDGRVEITLRAGENVDRARTRATFVHAGIARL